MNNINEIIARLEKANVKGIAVTLENADKLYHHPNSDWEPDDTPESLAGRVIVIDGIWEFYIGPKHYRARTIHNSDPIAEPGNWNVSLVDINTHLWATIPLDTLI